MNKKAQLELQAWPMILAIFGAGLAYIMAKRMDAGAFMIIVTTLLTGVVGYFMAYFIANK